ncbi:putative xyloglucan-specific endo-beta-1,4-glucanase A [Fulvia fulva]|uniref:Xyloglucan-specific endo-beta-1,4-glucanase A n=1 Tax=Passalora fulva TaxID=5499 RepID=A0A9Q8L9E3_PASFU|nr:putative xyloglucan-specific endo-beta-1,4-glucanase A [Fulvia fulva]KAK4632156.1 putative xyloglucan-specific endo-beta-1,4-glucanase A [Fulvia fulva]UJO13210.1 putative xyloglucan-specific endo-beta-1,4-glucanase A [Fulvia fulva]WPV11557.1 putative xyloglucan-specific endo-beta-1,4-glucanase A [Fulvia fulva]WPV25819.1 putative xyloglucan-specific endo-beta-1,4-glucanase A [Fulvia fulva]
MESPLAVLALALANLAIASPTPLDKRAENCEQYGSVQTGDYTFYNNLWGQAQATSGQQCFGVTGLTNNLLSWATTWSWLGDTSVKSYANAVLGSLVTSPKQLATVSSLDSEWSWTNEGSDVVADVASDLFTSSSAEGDEEFEIMIWLAALGDAGPISSTYGADGDPTALATTTIAGTDWSLYKGPDGQMTVYSFVAPSDVNAFSGDLMDFFDHLVQQQGFSTSQYLISAGAGTEAFSGSDVTFTTSAYSLTVA